MSIERAVTSEEAQEGIIGAQSAPAPSLTPVPWEEVVKMRAEIASTHDFSGSTSSAPPPAPTRMRLDQPTAAEPRIPVGETTTFQSVDPFTEDRPLYEPVAVLRRKIDQGVTEYETFQEATRPDGRQRWSDAELADRVVQRQEAVMTLLDQTVGEIATERAKAERTIRRIETWEPRDLLTIEQLQRVDAMRETVREESEDLDLSRLAQRIDLAATETSLDRPEAVLLLRYGRRRLTVEEGRPQRAGDSMSREGSSGAAVNDAPPTERDAANRNALRSSLERLESRLRPESHVGDLDKAKKVVADCEWLTSYAKRVRGRVDGTAAQSQDYQRRLLNSAF